MQPIIEVLGISKRYQLTQKNEHFWALKNISFKIKGGEVVGIIGRNGAGKSTLLKILSRITPPTEGKAILRGRVASLLEVGTGFSPEMTGRENIFLNGSILGMHISEIKTRFKTIVDFAEIGKFLDMPVKFYSSGMYTRLAFAIAAHLDPEILIIDEVLAVGDASFQRKSLGKMNEQAKKGRTVLFVSHNMGMIRQLCSRTLLLDEGKLIANGSTNQIISKYLDQKETKIKPEHKWSTKTAPGDTLAKLRKIRISNNKGKTTSEFGTHEPIFIEAEYELFQKSSRFRVGFELSSDEGTYILYSADSDNIKTPLVPKQEGRYITQSRIPENLLNSGGYKIFISGGVFGDRVIFKDTPSLSFTVISTGGVTSIYSEPRKGVIAPRLEWQTKKI